MKSASVSFSEVKQELLNDVRVQEEYDKLQPRYEIINQIVRVRQQKNMTQEQLAELIGTKKSNISRLESGKYNPSLEMLIKIAQALGKTLKLELK